jgi:Icc-related predicted phosphoesterase
MKLHEMSDLHLEGKNWKQFAQHILPDGKDVDALILAGDIAPLLMSNIEVYKELCKKHKWVFYVPGNHEYYKTSIHEAERVLAILEKEINNLVVLRAGSISQLEGRRIIGGTMWFKDDPMNFAYEHLVNDFRLIEGFKPWIYEENKKFLDFLQDELREGDIVITHHMPSALSVAERFKNDPGNRFFLCEISHLILERNPALWFHGHTHDPFDYRLGNTRIYCNPMGYSKEMSNTDFKNRFVVEV